MNDLLSELKSFAVYDPATGIFTAIRKRHRRSSAVGEPLGTLSNGGYLVLRIGAKKWNLSILAYLWMTGELPPLLINHINGDRADNSWKNLRLATPIDIARNRKKNTSNTSGFTGVYSRRNRWVARVDCKSFTGQIGVFDTPEDAAVARKEWFKNNEQLGFTDRHGD